MNEITKGMENFFGRGKFEIKPFADGVCCYIGSFGNVGVVETDEGLILFDLAIRYFGRYIFKAVRDFSDKPIKYIIYSHGHFDHCFGYAPFIKEIKRKNWEMPQIIAHENLLKRFAKYRMLENHQSWSYRQQFASVGVRSSDILSIHERLDPTIIIHGNESYEFKLGKYTFKI